ncbi:molybdate ABC transporter substrate-binding protein [Aquibium sp. A9E412]|uniref:molybdate ABC transporter substrate-binding protein n=1 Tax=Aquibium sp. A9E412 TaxID=2976767 RepID=UPI0025B27970|nr:molybdate ABC transporter substrate-binding protein [Aquibium sp. A9E412]MDN2567283.1 molybdate ABC transporter substrate-binding protein [Aquibium sp. A9E412]
MRRRFPALFAVLLLAGAALRPAAAADTVTVFAAASMKDAIDRAAVAYERMASVDVVVSFAASSVLAKQIAAGAPADLYISANVDWMDWLEAADALLPGSRLTIAGNTLVVAAPPGSAPQDDPAGLLGGGRFAMGDPSHVPAGRYGRAALESLGLWEAVRGNAVFTENVRVALDYVRRGEVAAGIVYGSDRAAAPGLVAVYTFAEGSHPAIAYPAALTAGAKPAAAGFLEFLAGAEGQAIFAALGFAPAPR